MCKPRGIDANEGGDTRRVCRREARRDAPRGEGDEGQAAASGDVDIERHARREQRQHDERR